MPLYRRKAIPLAAKPPDLKPDELVFQVRFTKEIFRDYGDYVKRINLYKQRIWTCKLTGKRNLTYDEALVSEKEASEEAQRFPKELMAPVLRDVQFSMLSLKELANMIATKLQGCLSEGSELYGRMKSHVYPCKIIRVVKKNKPLYQVSWMDKYDEVRENTLLKEEDLILQRLPCSKGALKLFIRESTYHSFPWIIHDKLAKVHGIPTHLPEELKGKFSLQEGVIVKNRKSEDHGIPTHPPEELKGKLSLQDEVIVRNRKRKKNGEIQKGVEFTELPDDSGPKRTDIRTGKAKCLKHEECIEGDTPKTHPIKYPIDDLLVQPSDSDKKLTERPCPQRDFNVPMHCVGDLLMVWDFGITFGKLLHLSPFSLEDFENAICHKDSNVVLIMEYHAALIRFLFEDSGVYLTDTPNRKHKPKITLITWTEYLSDFLETAGIAEMSSHITKIKCGQYGLLDIPAKLVILRELVAQALESDSFKQKLDGDIEKRQALVAAKRDEVMEEGRKRREEKERSKPQCAGKETINNSMEFLDTINNSSAHLKNLSSDDSKNRPSEVTFKNDKKQEINMKAATECMGDSPKKEDNKNEIEKSTQNKCKDHSPNAHKVLKNGIKEALENRSKEQRRQYLEREIEKTIIRTNPLGKDRDYNTYWFFRRDARIFVESPDSTQWGYYRSKEEFDALLGSLNVKGVRERALKKQLEKFYTKISSEYQKKTREEAQRVAMEEAVVRRSSRFKALPRPARDDPALAFLKYINKWNTTRL